MTDRVLVTPIADAEAMEAFRWYAERSIAVAQRWYAGLNKAISNLAKSPGRSPVSQEDSDALGCEVRILLHGRRTGVFRILDNIQRRYGVGSSHPARRPRPHRNLNESFVEFT